MTKQEIEQLYLQICEDIKTITVGHFIRLNDLKYATVYKFINQKPKSFTDLRFMTNLQRYFKICYGYENKKLNLIINK